MPTSDASGSGKVWGAEKKVSLFSLCDGGALHCSGMPSSSSGRCSVGTAAGGIPLSDEIVGFRRFLVFSSSPAIRQDCPTSTTAPEFGASAPVGKLDGSDGVREGGLILGATLPHGVGLGSDGALSGTFFDVRGKTGGALRADARASPGILLMLLSRLPSDLTDASPGILL